MRQSFAKSVNCSINGLRHAVKTERNFKIQVVCGISILLLGIEAKLSKTEWCILFLTVGFVLCMELINTCIEKTMDLVHPQYSEKVKVIKDIAAGMVLLSALVSVAIGIVLFAKIWFVYFD
ncbi:MAG: diacylglycerol kinase [Cytophagaceae bacterium]|jgi:diacylglycerol kinase|nr:diacylglycerol kinase [Cytophagaceae bacterium]